MRTLLTLDYEVYFGRNTGSVKNTLLEPTRALLRIAMKYGAKLVFFVDAGYILRLRAEMKKAPRLREDHDAICRQVESLAWGGHEIQLHIHPHWEDSRWEGDGWRIDTSRYALHSFEPAQIDEIVARYAAALREIAGPRSAYAFRAGGWVIQPFAKLRSALRNAGVAIDSTVYANGQRASATQPFDFHGMPRKSRWRFDSDPLVEVADGPFLEVPIASHRVMPDFFWRLAAMRKLGGERHRAFGDGTALPLEREELARRLLRPTHSVVSIDGYKASFLARAADDYRARGIEDFVVIGHPKAVTPYSLDALDAFLGSGKAGTVSTFSAYS